MKSFVLDLWHDLRTKRLAPVAVLLAAALVAVPLLVLKPVSEPAPAPAPAPKTAAQLPQLKSISAVAVTAGARGGSTLSAFNNKDPFKPPAVVLNAKRDEGSATASAPKSAAAAGTDSGGSGDSGSQGGSEGGLTTPPSTTPPATTAPPVTRAFAYTADVRFGRSGRTGRYRGLRKLESLPSERNPLLIFLGVTDDGDDAVFLVDATLRGAGEGRCSPSGSSCATLTIGAGAEHEFVDPDGDSYTLLVDQIRKVDLAKAATARKRVARARASVGASSPARRFVAPLLSDLLTVSTSGGDASSASRARR